MQKKKVHNPLEINIEGLSLGEKNSYEEAMKKPEEKKIPPPPQMDEKDWE